MRATLHDGTWDLTPADRLLVEAKRWGSRLRFAVMLLFFRARGRFPRTTREISDDVVRGLARTLGLPVPDGAASLLAGAADRTLERQAPALGQPLEALAVSGRVRSQDDFLALQPQRQIE